MRLEPPSTRRPSTRVAPRTIHINGRPTSIRLEPHFWQWLREISIEVGMTTKALIELIAATKSPHWPLTSALRLNIAEYFRNRITGPYEMMIDPVYGTRRPRSRQRDLSDTGRPPRPRAA